MDVNSDWDRPISQEELEAIEAIEAAFDSTPSSSSTRKRKRRQLCNVKEENETPTKTRKNRRLPGWIGIPPPTSLDLCKQRGFLRAQNQEVDLPAIKFGGQIVYCRTVPEVEKAMGELLKSLEAKRKSVDQVPIGFDIEWRPTFKRGVAPRKAAVMQICGDASRCYVIHIIHCGIPPILQSFLEDFQNLMVGVCITNDANKILNDYNVQVQALDELSTIANQKLGVISKNWSLASLTETLTGKQLEKPKRIRLGNWEVSTLSRDQLEYAATDAFVSWLLYEKLDCLPDALNNCNKDIKDG